MKQNIIYILWLLALLLNACTQEDIPASENSTMRQPVITVKDVGYANDEYGNTSTRTIENDLRTDFQTGDVCGLYIMHNGKLIAENVKLTAVDADGKITWQVEHGVELFSGVGRDIYYLYYPYQEDMEGKISTDYWDDTSFFAPLINDWQPKKDQSDYKSGYTASDLMTARGNLERNGDIFSLSFNMYHRMSLVIIELDKTVYNFTNTDPALPSYVIPTPVEFKGEYLPYITEEDSYRYIVNLNANNGVELNGSYENGNKFFTLVPANIPSGSYKTYLVDNAVITRVTDHYLQPGDFFMSDGSLVKKGTSLSVEQQKNCVGVVFYAGHNPEDDTDYSDTGIGKVKCNGYVMAVKDLPTSVYWSTETVKNDIITGGNSAKWDGYANMLSFKNNDVYNKYPAAAACLLYGIEVPSGTTSWYLPSIAQLVQIISFYETYLKQSVEYFNTSFKNYWYWSSTNGYTNDFVQVGKFESSSIIHDSKVNNPHAVCPILSF